MKRLLTGIALASLSLTVLMLLHRIGTLHDRLAEVRRPVERTVVVEKIVRAPAPELPEPPPPPQRGATAPAPVTATAEPTAEPPDVSTAIVPVPPTRALIRLDSAGVELDLELSDYQRARLDEHKRLRDLAHAAADEIYDAAVRMELSAGQYEKWKA